MNKLFLIRVGIIFFVISILMIILGKWLGITPQDIRDVVNSFGIFAPLAYSVILFLGLSVPFNPVSDFLVVNIAALLFPPHISILFTFIAHVMALSVNYYIAHKFGIKIIGKVAEKEKADTIIQFSQKLTPKSLFFLRFILPTSNLIGNDILSYLSGIQKMPFFKFFAVSIIPFTILNVLYFSFVSILMKHSKLLFFLPFFFILAAIVLYFILKKTKLLKF